MTSNPTAPAVILGNDQSLFVQQLARHWQSRGLNVAVVSRNSPNPSPLDPLPVLFSANFQNRTEKLLARPAVALLRFVERLAVSAYKQQYRQRTGRTEPDPWEASFASHLVAAASTTRAAQSLQPRFVFGQEVGAYGLPTVGCKGIPRVIFPWGADIFLSAETSPFFFYIINYTLQQADLIMPSSTTAAQHIGERYGIATSKVRALSWGIDRQLFRRPEPEQRARLRQKHGIPPMAQVLMNVRRFRPAWGCFIALEVFIRLAQEYPDSFFIMLGGRGTEAYVHQARSKLQNLGLLARFKLIEGDISLGEVAELMALSQITLSLLGRGDMRSASVLQGAAVSDLPVVSRLPEYVGMEKLGFRALFVEAEQPEQIYQTLKSYLDTPQAFAHYADENQRYLEQYEDQPHQLDSMLAEIELLCRQYASPAGASQYG